MKECDVEVGMKVMFEGTVWIVLANVARFSPRYAPVDRIWAIFQPASGSLNRVAASSLEPYMPTETWEMQEITFAEWFELPLNVSGAILTCVNGGLKYYKRVK